MILKLLKNEIQTCAGRDDLRAKVGTLLFSREFQVIAIYRIGRHIQERKRFLFLHQLLKWLMGVISGCEISPFAVIGSRLRLPHPTNVIIGEQAILGDDVTLYQSVTLGQRITASLPERSYPTIGDRVTIYANSSVIGGVVVGSGSVVGAHSLVLKNCPENSKLAGSPAKQLPAS